MGRMAFLTFREIKILDLLLNNDFISMEKIMDHCGISIRTAQAELRILKKVSRNLNFPFQITNQRGKGYTIDYDLENLEQIDKIRHYCQEYLNQNINHLFQNHYRVPIICQQLFLSSGYLKIEDLAHLLHVSESTIAKDLHQVKIFLNWYGLMIKSTPYNGMKITGSIMEKRCCMVDLFVLYQYHLGPEIAFDCVKPFFSYSQMLKVKNILLQKMNKYPNEITDTGFNRIVKYLLLINKFPKLKHLVNSNLLSLPEGRLAADLLQSFPEFDTKAEINALTAFILANSEMKRFANNRNFWQEKIPELNLCFNLVLKKIYYNYSLELKKDVDLVNLIFDFITQYLLKKKFGLHENGEYYVNKQNVYKLPASLALATDIIFALPDWSEGDFHDQIFLDFIMEIYNYICRLQNSYYPTHILLINGFGKIANETLLRKLSLDDHLQIYFDQKYFYELANLDLTKYDYLIVSRDIDADLSNISLPQMKFDFFMSSDFRFDFWGHLLMTKRKIGSVTNYLTKTYSVYLKGNIEEIIQKISEFVYKHSNFQNLMSIADFTCQLRIRLFNAADNSSTTLKYLILFTNKNLSNMSFIFNLANPVTYHRHLISGFQIIFLMGSKGLLEIKNGDSELRRYFEN